MTAALEPGTIDVLESTPNVLAALLMPLPTAIVQRPGPEGWSAKDVVAHLFARHDDALVGRVRLMLETGLEAHRGRALPEMIDDFRRRRAEAADWLRSLSAEQIARRGQHEVAGVVAIKDILHHLAYHDLLHLGQCARLVYAPYEAGRGAMRTSFPDAAG
jgi:hypothetical protein